MYLCVRVIEFDSFYDFSCGSFVFFILDFRTVSFCFSFYNKYNMPAYSPVLLYTPQ